MALARFVNPKRLPSLSGLRMWQLIFAAVVYHEATCDKRQLLSEEADRQVEKHPVLVYGFTAITVAHLLNWLPPKYDPYHLGWFVINKFTKGIQ